MLQTNLLARCTKMTNTKPAILDNDVPTIWITKEEYVRLRADQDVLNALEAQRIDTWSGYSAAMADLFGEDE